MNLFTSFGYCDSVDEDFLILKNIAASIKKGGTFIIECTSREIAIMHFTEGEEFERNGFFVKTEFSVSGAWEGLVSKWSLTDKTGFVYNHEFTQRLYSATDFVFLLLKFMEILILTPIISMQRQWWLWQKNNASRKPLKAEVFRDFFEEVFVSKHYTTSRMRSVV